MDKAASRIRLQIGEQLKPKWRVKVVLLQANGGFLGFNLLHTFIYYRYNALTTNVLYTTHAKLENSEPKIYLWVQLAVLSGYKCKYCIDCSGFNCHAVQH